MNLLKKLFAKKPEKKWLQIAMPFNIKAIQHRESYFNELFSVLNKEATVSNGDEFELLFGSTETTHIIYYCYEDVSILMQPENNGWTATSVWSAGMDGSEKIAEKTNMPFLFKFKNPYFGDKQYFDDDFRWSEYMKVYQRA